MCNVLYERLAGSKVLRLMPNVKQYNLMFKLYLNVKLKPNLYVVFYNVNSCNLQSYMLTKDLKHLFI